MLPEDILNIVLTNCRKFSDCKDSNGSIDELIESIARDKDIQSDSNEWKILTEFSKIAVNNLNGNQNDKIEIRKKAQEYLENEERKKAKINKEIENGVLLKEINVRLCLLTTVATGNIINYF